MGLAKQITLKTMNMQLYKHFYQEHQRYLSIKNRQKKQYEETGQSQYYPYEFKPYQETNKVGTKRLYNPLTPYQSTKRLKHI